MPTVWLAEGSLAALPGPAALRLLALCAGAAHVLSSRLLRTTQLLIERGTRQAACDAQGWGSFEMAVLGGRWPEGDAHLSSFHIR